MENVNNLNCLTVEELKIKQYAFILIASKRQSGKTVMLRHLIKYYIDTFDFQLIIIFSDTAKFNGDYTFLDQNFIYKTEELEDKLSKILSIQEKNILKGKIVNILIILDDVKIHSKSKELINLASMGRHFKITTILSSQYPKQLVSSSIRNNLSYIFINDLGYIALRAIYESIHIKMSYKEFQNYVDDNNNDFQFIFYNGMIQSKERLFLVRATELKNLVLK